jgi:N-acetylmuramoyl-L-alanine amidase
MFQREKYFLFVLVFLCITINIDAQKMDYPRRNEGINAFLHRHNRDGNAYYHEFIRLNKKRLGKNNSLLRDVKYIVPAEIEAEKKVLPLQPDTFAYIPDGPNNPAVEVERIAPAGSANLAKKLKEPLFGKKYESFDLLDNELAGAEFYLVSGHGGPDCGAVAHVAGHELHEDEYAYDVVLRLARNLMQHGASVKIIIQDKKDGIRDDLYLRNSETETCMGKAIPLNQKKRLRQRSDKINSLAANSRARYKRAIFVHLDSRSRKTQLDVFFYYQNGNRTSLDLAETMRKTFHAKYEKFQPGRGFSGTVTTRPLSVLTRTEPVSIFVELANMHNASDQKRYVLADNRQALANWLADGFIRDYRTKQ